MGKFDNNAIAPWPHPSSSLVRAVFPFVYSWASSEPRRVGECVAEGPVVANFGTCVCDARGKSVIDVGRFKLCMSRCGEPSA